MKPPNTEAAQLLAKRLLDTGTKEMTAHEQRVIERVAKRVAVSRNINAEYDQGSKFGGAPGGQGCKLRRLMDLSHYLWRAHHGLGWPQHGHAGAGL